MAKTATLNTVRHDPVFNAAMFGNRRVDVVGAGALGSHAVVELARLGIKNIHVWDFDKVERHNVCNQACSIEEVGKPKVSALKDYVKWLTGTVLNIHEEKIEEEESFGDVVFVLTDSMASRKQIFEKSVKYHMNVKLLVESRIGPDNGRIYAIDPCLPNHVEGYEKTLYEDRPQVVSACGEAITIGATAITTIGVSTWQFMRWFANVTEGKKDKMDNEILFSLRPTFFITKQF